MVESLRVGPYTDDKADMGPVVTKEAQTRIKSLIDRGVEEGAKLVVDGRNFSLQGYEDGFFVGGCLFDNVTPEMDIYKTKSSARSSPSCAPRTMRKRSICR